MDLAKLGYDEKWVARGFLTEELFNKQLEAFEKSEKVASEFRYESFQNWLTSKESFTDKEVAQYIKQARTDKDQSMAGRAVTDLFNSTKLTDSQFDFMCIKLPSFGDWTRKLIVRKVLEKSLATEPMTESLYQECLNYKKEFKDNRLLLAIIEKTEDVELLSKFESNGSGKQLRKLAAKKVKRLSTQAN